MATAKPPNETENLGHPTNLPVQLTTFVGREREVAEVRQLVSSRRLLTLTGAGGVGKTRLALQVASELLDTFSDGVWLVELASLSDPELLDGAVASSIGVKGQPGRSAGETLAAVMQTQSVLLVLDNCEHLVAACAQLVDFLLHNCPRLHILSTSRERLNVPGETAWRVPSLSLPDVQSVAGTDELAACEAVRLFLDRARLVHRTFAMDDRNARAVALLCRRLDGIPLAIELAAARVSVLAPEQIVARLDDRFELLVGGSRTAPSRQQTLRATLDWSYGLLPEPERSLLRKVSVFAGGFSIEAAEAVCRDVHRRTGDVLDLLAGLVDKSLVAVDSDDATATRYGVLETVRQYGWELLAACGESDVVQQQHAEYFLALAEEAEPDMAGSPGQSAWLNRIEREHGNFRAALQWSVESNTTETGVRLAAALYRLWYLRGYLAEGRRWFDQILARSDDAPLPARVRAFRGNGLLAYAAGDLGAAQSLTERSLRLARELDDDRLIAASLNNLCIILIDQGEYAAARAHGEEGLTLARALGDSRFSAILLNNLGLCAACERDYPSAVPLLDESLALATANGMKEGMAWATGNLGNIAFHRGHFDDALARYRQSLALGVEVGDKRVIVERIEELAWVAAAQEQEERAARLFGYAESLRETVGAPMPPANRADYDRSLAIARARLGDIALADLWERGRILTLEQAIDEAMAVEVRGAERHAGARPGSLTEREFEVARLVGQGLTNREIADKLIVSVRTAEAHVTHVLAKLGLRSRAQLAVWAADHGLLRK